MLLALILTPFFAAIAAWLIASNALRRKMLLSVACIEFVMVAFCWAKPPQNIGGDLLNLDSIGLLVMSLTVCLFLACAIYAQKYFKDEPVGTRKDNIEGLAFLNAPESTFTACMLLFLASSMLVACTQHFGLLWVGIETTTLASAPLIYFHRHKRSLEATWKYLIICSVGMALALMGNILLDVSMQTQAGEPIPMTLSSLLKHAPNAQPDWFKAAFIFIFIGYGTKMGIAPMHTWLPDTYSEAPSISTVLSGALLHCAFLGIFRIWQVCLQAGLADFASKILISFGVISMVLAALFIIKQRDFRRMLAYSSIEHMGILLIGLGVGLAATQGSLAHMVNHAFVKAGLFLLAGKIVALYTTRLTHDITGLQHLAPLTAKLWLAGSIALVGAPPFALFWSEFMILQGILARGLLWLGIAYLLALGCIFVAMMTSVLHMYRGDLPAGIQKPTQGESLLGLAPSACLFLFVLILGFYIPTWLQSVIQSAASFGFRP